MEANETKVEPAAAPKPRSRAVVLSILMVVVAVGAAAVGAVVGPRLLVAAVPAAAHPSPSSSSESMGEIEGESVQFESIVVDLHDDSGNTHHLKLGLAAELPEKVDRKMFERYMPRARQAAIAYLRALKFKDATSSEKFPRIRDQVCEQVSEAIGPARVRHVLVTDYVTQ